MRIGVYETVGPWYSWWPAWGNVEKRGGVAAGAGDESGVGGEADEGEAAVGCYVDLRGGVGNGETGKEEGWDAVTVNVIV